MSVEALKRLRKNLRANLTRMEKASAPGEDTAAMAELKDTLRFRIASLDAALRQEQATPPQTHEETPSPPKMHGCSVRA
jgi:hypothetical protein